MRTRQLGLFLHFLLAAAILNVAAGGAAPAEPVRFVDIEIETRSLVFVCDGSRWTKVTLIELADEVARTVGMMKPNQRFALLFFADDETTAPFDGKSVLATDENKGKLRDWLDDVKLGDKPTPVPTLRAAFALKPDTVIFVSDGKFPDYDGVESEVATLNRDKAVRLHAVGFFRSDKEDDSGAFARFMQTLADRNAGVFKAAYANELRRRS